MLLVFSILVVFTSIVAICVESETFFSFKCVHPVFLENLLVTAVVGIDVGVVVLNVESKIKITFA